jgi:Outer membrane protein Omp28
MMRTALPLALLALLSACDYVDQPFQKGEGPVTPPDNTVQRKVLLEEFTGHQCPTCPAAHVVAQQLLNLYGSQLIIVSEHVGSLAYPIAGDYSTDFRTPAGDAYFVHWPTDIIPRGLINRTAYNNNVVLAKSSWSDAMTVEFAKPATFKLWFDTFSYDMATQQVTATVKCSTLLPLDHAVNLTLQLTEDHISDWQYDQDETPPDVQNYDHRHVLRGNVNGTWGEPLFTGPAAVGDTAVLSYSWTLPSTVLNPNNCALVAYAWNAVGTAGEYEVQQVEERKFP